MCKSPFSNMNFPRKIFSEKPESEKFPCSPLNEKTQMLQCTTVRNLHQLSTQVSERSNNIYS
jgi:hypothetical protein